ncbi:MAG: RAMP superfamily CRISPR-associated protein [Chloroflexota bacterium]
MQIRIEVTISFEAGFNIGSGAMGGALARRPLALDWRGLPYIPASSFKGRLRHTCKQLAEGLDYPTCREPEAQTMCPNGPMGAGYCLICYLFGSPGRPSPLTFSDLPLVQPEFLTEKVMSLPTSLRYGVGLSRRRRVAADNLLYDTEVFLPGGPVSFAGEIQGRLAGRGEAGSENVIGSDKIQVQPDRAGLGLLVAGLENLVTLGRGKTAGLGWFQPNFEVYEVKADHAERPLARDDIKKWWLG